MTTYDTRLQTPAYRRLRLYILERDGHTCRIRGPRCTQAATQVDHITPRADGGSVYDPTNLRAACRTCNMWLSAARTNRLRYHTGVARYDTRM